MENTEKIKIQGDLLNTACIVQMPQPVGTLTYLDIVETQDTVGNMPELSLVPFTKLVHAETHRVQSLITKANYDDLANYRDGAINLIKPVLYNEIRIGIEKSLYQKYLDLGLANAESKKSKWVKWVEKTFKTDLPVYTDSIVNHLLTLSNRIAASGRRGPANFVIVSNSIFAKIEESPMLKYRQTQSTHTGSYNLVGSINDLLDIYVSNMDKWDSEQIVIGRKSSVNEPGVYYCEYSNEFETILDEVGNHKCSLCSRSAIVNVGNKPEVLYYAENVKIGKKPFWRKLFRL